MDTIAPAFALARILTLTAIVARFTTTLTLAIVPALAGVLAVARRFGSATFIGILQLPDGFPELVPRNTNGKRLRGKCAREETRHRRTCDQ